MAGQLERLLQSMLQTAPSLVTQVVALLQAPTDPLFSGMVGSPSYGSGTYGTGVYGGSMVAVSGITDSIETHANGAIQLIWDSGTQGFWDDFCWDTPAGALAVGGLVWDSGGTNGKWDQAGVVWNP